MGLPWWLRWRCRKGFHRWAPWERDFETWTATLRCIHCPVTRTERLAHHQIRFSRFRSGALVPEKGTPSE